jgi:hypothetical protein
VTAVKVGDQVKIVKGMMRDIGCLAEVVDVIDDTVRVRILECIDARYDTRVKYLNEIEPIETK